MTSLFLLVVLGAKLDVKVEGEGYLRFAHDGRIVYAKSAELTVFDGRIGTSSGASLMPMMLAPANIQLLEAQPDGRIFAVSSNVRKELGRITFAVFGPQESLSKQGEFLLAKSRPRLAFPEEGGAGKLAIPTGHGANLAIGTESKPPSTRSGAIVLTIPPTLELDGGRMTLDRFVQNPPPAIVEKLRTADFGPIPTAGFPTKITRARVLAKLQYAGIHPNTLSLEMPDLVVVSAASQVVEGRHFVEAGLAGVVEKLGANIELKVQGDVLPLTVPKGELKLKADSIQQRDKSILATIAVYVEGRRITAKQIEFTGEQAAVAVKANDLVKVVIRANGVAIETTGRAKKSAHIGETVEVEVVLADSNAKSVHLGVVKGPGTVEVRL